MSLKQTLRERNIRITPDELQTFCESHHIHSLSLFGSVLRDDFHQNSDIDMLVNFDPNARIGLIRKAAIQAELSDLLGRQVDLRTPAELSRYFQRSVCRTAQNICVHLEYRDR